MTDKREKFVDWCDCERSGWRFCTRDTCPIKRRWRDEEHARDERAMDGPPDVFAELLRLWKEHDSDPWEECYRNLLIFELGRLIDEGIIGGDGHVI